MGNYQSTFSEDKILLYDRVLQNYPLFNSGFNKEVLNAFSKGTYAGIRNYRKFNEKVSLQTGKWWKVLF